MAKFNDLPAEDVLLGRARKRRANIAPYLDALSHGALAGSIELDAKEKPETCRDYLREAARILKMRIRSSYEDGERVIYWKVIGA